MTRFWLFILLAAVGIAAAFFGLCTWDTARAGASFTAVALFLYSLFGGEA